MSFNISGTLLLVRFESTPHAVHLFSFPSPADSVKEGMTLVPRLRSVLLHSQPVVKAAWNPVRKGSLALSCSGGGLYLWSDEWVGDGEDGDGEEVAECVGVPARKHRPNQPRSPGRLTHALGQSNSRRGISNGRPTGKDSPSSTRTCSAAHLKWRTSRPTLE